jgi:hypothetical protein
MNENTLEYLILGILSGFTLLCVAGLVQIFFF